VTDTAARPGTARLFADIVRACRVRASTKIADSTGAKLTGPELLLRTLVARRFLRRAVLAPDERFVGVFLPPAAGAVVANMALVFDRRVPVNLNYTLSPDMLDACIAKAGIRHVLTSRRFLDRLGVSLSAEPVFLEDLAAGVSRSDKLLGAAESKLPAPLLLRALGVDGVAADELLTVVFTSGTTGVPKGVMLSFGNVEANLAQIDHVVHWTPDDVVIGVLPFFHSFGSTVMLWAMVTRDIRAVYHSNPLEAQIVGRLTREHGGTILPATPMFLRTYLRRCDPGDFATLELAPVGAEKLPPALGEAFARTFDVEVFEGYGATEMSPLVAANVPASRAVGRPGEWSRAGTVGRPVPGVRTRVVDPDTGEDLPIGEPGMLLVTGPNLMRGYLDDPAATAAAIRDGWYVTGDLAVTDEEGFIHLKDRLSRFAKIAGEMVPHGAVEEALMEILGADDAGMPRAVVTSIPDEARGERIVVVHTAIEAKPDELREKLAAAGLPNLFIPSKDSFVEVAALPLVGAGKLDLKRLRQVALDAFARQPAAGVAGGRR
jgi:acyl-[acyl-carrier-protein]-phospholipid O-acyltransferase / long-chain-fatty-acid--[acyl-carrier-protein] ligase